MLNFIWHIIAYIITILLLIGIVGYVLKSWIFMIKDANEIDRMEQEEKERRRRNKQKR